MCEEIQLEAAAQHGLIHLSDAALQGRAGIRDDDIDPAKPFGRAIEGGTYRGRIGHIAGEAERRATEPGRGARGGLGVEVEQHDFGAGRAHSLRRRETDRAGAAGDQRDLAEKRFFFGQAELRLLQRPVFHLEQFGLGQRLEPADRLRACDGLDPALGDVGRYRGIRRAAADTEQPQPRHEKDAGHRIELALVSS